MAETRLRFLDKLLAERVDLLDAATQRRVARECAAWAARRAGLDAPWVRDALALLEQPPPWPAEVVAKFHAEAEQLDSGAPASFPQARAAAAISAAFDADSTQAAGEAAYEAHFATPDEQPDIAALRSVIQGALED